MKQRQEVGSSLETTAGGKQFTETTAGGKQFTCRRVEHFKPPIARRLGVALQVDLHGPAWERNCTLDCRVRQKKKAVNDAIMLCTECGFKFHTNAGRY